MDCPITTDAKPAISVAQSTALRAHLPVIGALLLSASPYLLAGGIYKSIDSDGNIIFTDRPSENAEAINSQAKKQQASSTDSEAQNYSEEHGELQDEDDDENEDEDEDEDTWGLPATTVLVAPEPVNPPIPEPAETPEPSSFLPVNRVEILTPGHDTTFLDPLGQIWVEVQSYPTSISQSGLIAQLWMDETLITSDKATQLRLPPPARGTHVLQVKLVDGKGRLIKTSPTIHIHVKYRFAEQ